MATPPASTGTSRIDDKKGLSGRMKSKAPMQVAGQASHR
jgi:hypothetical protein